MEWLNWIRDNM